MWLHKSQELDIRWIPRCLAHIRVGIQPLKLTFRPGIYTYVRPHIRKITVDTIYPNSGCPTIDGNRRIYLHRNTMTGRMEFTTKFKEGRKYFSIIHRFHLDNFKETRHICKFCPRMRY